MKLLKDNIRENLDELGYGDAFFFFFITPPKTQSMKETTDKLDFIKIKNFCSEKDIVKRSRRQVTGWEKILAKIYLIKDHYLQYLSNSTIRKLTIQFKN